MKRTGKILRYFIQLALLLAGSPVYCGWTYPPPPPMPGPGYFQPGPAGPQQCQGLESQVAGLNTALVQERNKNAVLTQQAAYYYDMQQKMAAEINQLRSDNQSPSQQSLTQLTSVNVQIEQLKAENTILKSEINALKEAEVTLPTKSEEPDKSQSQISVLQSESEDQTIAFDALQTEYEVLSEQYALSIKSALQTEDLTQELNKLQAGLEVQEKKLMDITRERDTLVTSLQSLNSQEPESSTNELELSVLRDALARTEESDEINQQELAAVNTQLLQCKEREAQSVEDKTQCAEKDQSVVDLRQENAKLLAQITDTDSDGVVDANDECPDTESGSLVNTTGCLPDGDKDGIQDAADLCPESPEGEVANSVGCASDETIVLSGVNFKFNSAIFVQKSLPVLDNVIRILEKQPAVRLEIAGYTDNSGQDGANLVLSQQRADAVWDYLTKSGIQGGRLVSSGYGAMSPVADNSTIEGRAKNRRVELHILSQQGPGPSRQ